MRVIVTRPEREAQAWVHSLLQHGVDAVALPLIAILAPEDSRAVRAAWERLNRYTAVMFVSGSAVEHFFGLRTHGDPFFGDAAARPTQAWAPGPGTAAALSRHGVGTSHIRVPGADAVQFDSEALWEGVAATVRAGDRILIVRGDEDGQTRAAGAVAGPWKGGSGRDWLANRLLQAGAQVDFVVAYERTVPVFDAIQRDRAQRAARDGSLWLFTSSQAVANLVAGMSGLDWSGARALATHARIAGAARAAGFGVVWQSRPSVADVLASIESIA